MRSIIDYLDFPATLLGDSSEVLWSNMPGWTIEEATALSFGWDPDQVNGEFLATQPYLCSDEYRNRLRLARRAEQMGDLKALNRPVDYLKWAQRASIPFCPHLQARIWQLTRESALSSSQNQPSRTNEESSLLGLIFGMAVTHYGYDPNNRRSNAVSKIRGDLATKGIFIDSGTIRSWIREAAEDQNQLPIHVDGYKQRAGLKRRARLTLLKLALGLAVAIYGYNPGDARSMYFSEIADDLVGYDIGENVIGTLLREAAD